MKKAKFKYPIGTEVKFKFFDGSIHVGSVVKQSYQGDSWDHLPTNYGETIYTIQVPTATDKRGFMMYPSIGPNRIIESNGVANKGYVYGKLNILDTVTKRKTKRKPTKVKQVSKSNSTELSDAISKQKDFINGKINN